MKTLFIVTIAMAVLLSGCSSNKVVEALKNIDGQVQAANCTKVSGSSQVLGQTRGSAQTCTCTISRDAGVRVTEARVSADENGRCEMSIAPVESGDSQQ